MAEKKLPNRRIVTVTQPAFTGGVVSPAIYSRRELDKYPISLRKIVNWFVSPHGGISTRGGTEYITTHKNENKKIRMIPFEYSAEEAYMLEFGELETPVDTTSFGTYTGYIRFFVDYGVPLITSGVSAHADTGYTIGSLVTEGSTTYICLITHATNETPGAADSDYWYELVTIPGGATGEAFLELPTYYVESDVLLFNVEQDEEIMYVTRKNKKTMLLQAPFSDGYTHWHFIKNVFGSKLSPPTGLAGGVGGGKYKLAISSFDSKTGEESELSVDIEVDVSVEGETPEDFYWTTFEGDSVMIYVKETSGVYNFTTRHTPEEAPPGPYYYEIPETFRLDRAQTGITEELDPFAGANEGPNVAAFYEQRIIFANDRYRPQTLIASVSGEPHNMNRHYPLIDSDAYLYKINARKVNEVRWMVAMDRLIMGTAGAIWSMTAGKNANAVTPTSPPSIIKQTDIGASTVPPLVIGKTILFIDSTNKIVRDLFYSYEVDGYDGSDLSILAEHLFENAALVSWCYQRDPDSIVWCVRDDGTLLGLTYYKEHKIWAWHEHVTGADGFVMAVSCVRSSAGEDVVYMSVLRYIDGQHRRYIEVMKPRLPDGDMEKAWCVDSGKSYNFDPTPTTTITGLSHLKGKTVVALGDGNTYNDPLSPLIVDEDGEIELPQAVTQVQVGLGYECDFETLDLDAQEGETALIDKKKRGIQASMRLRDSLQFKVGSDENNLLPVPFRYGEELSDPTELFSGVKTMGIKPKLTSVIDTDRGTRIAAKVVDPVPVTIQSITLEIEYGEAY